MNTFTNDKDKQKILQEKLNTLNTIEMSLKEGQNKGNFSVLESIPGNTRQFLLQKTVVSRKKK